MMNGSFNGASRLREHARARPDSPALCLPSASYTPARPAWDTVSFGALERRSDALAHGLARLGVRPGDRSLILFRPNLDFYAVTFALYKVGAVPVLLDPRMGFSRLMHCIAQAAPRVCIGLPIVHLIRRLQPRAFAAVEIALTAGRPWPWGPPSLDACARDTGEPFPLVARAAGDACSLLFTSGSTGPPKGVVCTQEMFQAQIDALGQMLHLRPGLRDVQAFAPFAMFDLCAGMCAILPRIDLTRPARAPPEAIIAALEAHRPEVAFGSPILWFHLSRHCRGRGLRLPAPRVAITVGAPIPAWLLRDLREILPEGAEVLTPYGATEGLPLTNISSAEILEDAWEGTVRGEGTCVGRPAPGATLRIIPITEDEIPAWHDELGLPAGRVGEVLAGGVQVSPAYHAAPEANRLCKVRDGERILHRMGDLGYLDDRGRLWFCGRKSERLETAAGLVFPVPVEGVFNEHPEVFRTALVGVGPRGREIPVLCVEMEPGHGWSSRVAGELEALARGTRYEGLVRHFLPHPGFPTDARHNSKIRREDLRAWAAARLPAAALEGSR